MLTVNALNFDINESGQIHRAELSRYTKHYYIGSERVSSALGSLTKQNLGVLCEPIPTDAVTIERMNTKVEEAGTHLLSVHQYFEKQLQLATPYFYEGQKGWVTGCGFNEHNIDLYDAYWYHPDHTSAGLSTGLGSSSYITNLAGEITQHMEYLPFGETLVEEHLNSYNSPFKFNAKEYDAETGNYYYGARYYNPKWSIWLSVDPMAEKYPSWSSYNYTLQNPVKYVDPNGKSPFWRPNSNGDLIAEVGDNAQTLAKHLNIGSTQAQGMLKRQGLRNANDQLVNGNDEVMSGQIVKVDNNMTRSIKNSNGKTPTGPDQSNPITPSTDNYICDQASQMAVDGVEINPTNAKKYNQFLPGLFTKGYSEVENFDNVGLGKGIAVIGGQHVVTNYGQRKDGTQYVYSKDGRFYKPQVRTLDETIKLYNENEGTNFTRQDVKYYKQDIKN